MQIITEMRKKYVLLFYLIILIIPASLCFAEADSIINILKPQTGINPRNLTFFTDQSGACNISYQYQHENAPNEIYFVRPHGEIWSAPIYLDLKTWSNVYLCDITNLSDNTPLMVLLGDNTDYARIFDVSAIDDGEDIPAALGMTEAEFSNMLLNNQRLFASFMINGQWAEPAAIPGTYGASKAMLDAGSDGSALVLFSRDADNSIETIGDIDLFATVYKNGTWSEIVRITDNEKADYGSQIVFIRGKYLIVWASDDDNNIETDADRLLNYAVVGSDGREIVNSIAIMNQFQTNPIPVLGKYKDKAILMWSSEPLSEEDLRRPVWEIQYENNWGTPQKTGLLNYQMGSGSLHEIGNSLVLIYHEAGTLQAATNEGDGWFTSGALINFNLLSLDASDASYYPDNKGNLHIGLTGFIPGREKNYENEFDGIYYTERSLKCDLAMYNVNASPRKKKIGQDMELQFTVYNSGYFKSGKFSVLVKEDQKLLKKFEEEGLPAGEEQSFSYKVKMDKATMNFEMEIITGSEESNKDNNRQIFSVKVLPDYTVRSVARKGTGQVVARVMEEKGIAAPPVPVDFYIVIDGESKKIGSGTYDPIADEPVGIEWQDYNTVTGSYQLIAEVNQPREVQEDDYANNKGSFIFNPLPDFVVENFTTSKEAVSVTLKNIGEKAVSKIDILVTDNPEVVAADDINAVFGDLHYYQEVALDENQSATVNINYSRMNELQDKRIYAVVNPKGSTAESDQNNNLATTLVKLRDTLPAGGRQLIFGAVFGYGSRITVTLVNTTDDPAMTPKIELVNSRGIVVNQQILPVVKAHGWNKLVFSNIESGQYTIRLITNWTGNNPDVLETSVQL